MLRLSSLRNWPQLLLVVVLLAQVLLLLRAWSGQARGEASAWALELSLALGVGAGALAWLIASRAREQALRAKDQLEEAIDALPASVEIFDERDRIVAFNQRLVEIYPHMLREFERGASFEELVRASLARGGIPEAQGREEAWLTERKAVRGKQQREALLQRVHDNKWLRIYERRMPGGGIVGVRMDVSDLVHEQQRLAASQAHLQALIHAASNGIVTLDTAGHMLEVNPACETLFGFTAQEMQGAHLSMLIGNAQVTAEQLLPSALMGAQREFAARHREGHELAVQLNVAEVKTATTHLFVCVITDFSERKRQEMRLREANALLARQSTTDGLTGVGNRRLFDQLLIQEWQRSVRSSQPLAMLLVDIDHFKQYNDRYGHVAGDDCLRRVASLLKACVGRSVEAVCRYGGEEFAVLLVDTDLQGAEVVAQRCLDSLRLAAISHEASPVRPWVSLSIGVAACVADAQRSPQALLQAADEALYQAKQAGRARMVFGQLSA